MSDAQVKTSSVGQNLQFMAVLGNGPLKKTDLLSKIYIETMSKVGKSKSLFTGFVYNRKNSSVLGVGGIT